MASRGLFTIDGVWIPIPCVDAHQAELLFRHKVLRLLRDKDLITQERIDLLLSWKNSGFGVHNHTTVYPHDTEGLHKLAWYLMRAPVNLSRLCCHPESELILYESKSDHDAHNHELMDPLEFLARVLIHVPEPNKHLVRFYGAYANRSRLDTFAPSVSTEQEGEQDEGEPPRKRALNKRWAELVYRIYEVNPLELPFQPTLHVCLKPTKTVPLFNPDAPDLRRFTPQ